MLTGNRKQNKSISFTFYEMTYLFLNNKLKMNNKITNTIYKI